MGYIDGMNITVTSKSFPTSTAMTRAFGQIADTHRLTWDACKLYSGMQTAAWRVHFPADYAGETEAQRLDNIRRSM
jgi:hypothetical protein